MDSTTSCERDKRMGSREGGRIRLIKSKAAIYAVSTLLKLITRYYMNSIDSGIVSCDVRKIHDTSIEVRKFELY